MIKKMKLTQLIIKKIDKIWNGKMILIIQNVTQIIKTTNNKFNFKIFMHWENNNRLSLVYKIVFKMNKIKNAYPISLQIINHQQDLMII